MDEKKRIEEIKSGLKKSVYEEATRIQIDGLNLYDSTEKLSNILEGYVDRIDEIEAASMEEFEEELRVLKNTNVEVGEIAEKDNLVQQYNDYIHNDLDRTIAETVEYTYNLNNKTDDLNDILIRPMEDDEIDDIADIERGRIPQVEFTIDTDDLFEIEATTDLGVFEDIVELEEDTLDIAGTVVTSEVKIGKEYMEEKNKSSKQKKVKNKKNKKVKAKKVKAKKVKAKKAKKNDFASEFEDDKELVVLDYILIVILVIVFAILIGLVAKINGAF